MTWPAAGALIGVPVLAAKSRPECGLRLAVEETAQAERRGQRAVHRAVEQQIARLAGAELPVGAVLLIQFTLDALEVCGVRVDLALVLQGDVLRAIVAVANLEAGAAAIDLQLLGPAFADSGMPTMAIQRSPSSRTTRVGLP